MKALWWPAWSLASATLLWYVADQTSWNTAWVIHCYGYFFPISYLPELITRIVWVAPLSTAVGYLFMKGLAYNGPNRRTLAASDGDPADGAGAGDAGAEAARAFEAAVNADIARTIADIARTIAGTTGPLAAALIPSRPPVTFYGGPSITPLPALTYAPGPQPSVPMYTPGPWIARSAFGGTWTPAKSHADIPAAPMEVGEIIAWRAWRTDGYWIKAVFADLVWAPGDAAKVDSKDGSRLDQGGGIHAWKDKTAAVNYVAGDPTDDGKFSQFVIGRVALWGEVVEHEKGYRAEIAKPVSFDEIVGSHDMITNDGLLVVLRTRYGLKAFEP